MTTKEIRENCNKTRKGGTVPNDSSRRFNRLLPISTTGILNEVLSAFRSHLSNGKASIKFKLSRGRKGDEITILGNKHCKFTNGLKTPKKNHIFIELRKQAFSFEICGWLAGVVDCIHYVTKK